MQLVKIVDGKPVRYSLFQLRRDNPNVSFPEKPTAESLSGMDVYPVVQNAQPDYDRLTQELHDRYQLVNGQWHQVWTRVERPVNDREVAVAQAIDALKESVRQRLDDFAATRGYDSMLSACSYATSSVPAFADEGRQCVTLRDATWSAWVKMLDDVAAGSRTLPTLDELLAELPTLAWDGL